MVKKNNECKVTVDGAARYDFPYFVPIEDGDEVTIKHYKKHDVPVANIALLGRKKRYYAIFGAASKEEADYKMSRPNVQKILYKNVQLVCLS